MRATLLLALTSALLAGCTPQDGEVTGDYVGFIAAASSATVNELQARRVPLDDQETLDRLGFVPIDCRELAAEDEGQRLHGASFDNCLDENGDVVDAQWFPWLQWYSFYKKEGAIEPYRVEAVMTSENDLQLTVHMDIGRLGDFRFGWVIDPTFQPTTCVDGDGGSVEEQIDGDWVANWSSSSTEGTGTQYYLNAYAYQVNPQKQDEYWGFDQRWYAGYSYGRFGEEVVYGHQTDYQDPYATSASPYGEPMYYLTYRGDFVPTGRAEDYTDWAAKIQQKFDPTASNYIPDFSVLGQSDFPLEMRVEDNTWRTTEAEAENESNTSYAYGLENWVGVNSSWVHFDADPETIRNLQPGKLDQPLTGTFQTMAETAASATKVFVHGSFSIDHIRKDTWGYDRTLDEIKRDENNTPECGDNRLTTDSEASN